MAREQAAVIRFALPSGTGVEALPALAGAVAADEGIVTVSTATPTSDLQLLTTWATGRGVDLVDLSLSRATLEDVYLRLTGDAGDRA